MWIWFLRMLFFNYELWVVNYEFTFLWKWEASSKNNALTNLVRWGSSAGKCVIFYLLMGLLWLLLCWIDAFFWVISNLWLVISELLLWKGLRHLASVKAMEFVVSGKWKIILLLSFFWFCGCQKVIMNGELWIMNWVDLEL